LRKTLKEAQRNDLCARNVAAEHGARKIEAEEVIILADDQVNDMLTKLADRVMHAPVVVALFTA